VTGDLAARIRAVADPLIQAGADHVLVRQAVMAELGIGIGGGGHGGMPTSDQPVPVLRRGRRRSRRSLPQGNAMTAVRIWSDHLPQRDNPVAVDMDSVPREGDTLALPGIDSLRVRWVRWDINPDRDIVVFVDVFA
jgi:hypothetical protein